MVAAVADPALRDDAIKNVATMAEVDFKWPCPVSRSGNDAVQEAFTGIKARLAANP